MYLHLPPESQRLPLVFVTDYRLPSDARADDHFREINAGSNPEHVLEFYQPGRMAIGTSLYHRCARIALFDAGSEPDSNARKRARVALSKALARIKPKVVAVIPNEVGGTEARGQTLCWGVFGAPDSCANMRGTFFAWADALVCPLHAPSPWAKQLQHWQQDRFIRRCLEVAEGKTELLRCKKKIISPGVEMAEALAALEWNCNLAVDIESIESCDKVTAIGISDGISAISVPWHSFLPADGKPERGIDEYGETGELIIRWLKIAVQRAPYVYFHNHTFDVPRLRAEGFQFDGAIHDTMAAHAIAFPELRHGLQFACADMLPIAPWKSVWHPKAKGLTRDDEEFWTCDPIALRDYNADDAFHTYHLAMQVAPCVEFA